MVGSRRQFGADPRGTSRWSFADCLFDEADWTLTVAGQRVAIETKPLEVLRLLVQNAQHLVSKNELMDAVWPDVEVVEASLPTAIRKLRLALADDDRVEHLVETVPRIGYRLAVPATIEQATLDAVATGAVVPSRARLPTIRRPRLPIMVAAAALGAVALVAAMVISSGNVAATAPNRIYSDKEAIIALRRLDVAKIDTMIADGWKPDVLDAEDNNALNRLLEICEWNPGHDRAKLLVIARALLDGGVSYHQRNKWGDTAYSIAKAKRYCGPNHPVTVMLRNLCYAKGKAIGDTCLATYKVKRQPAA